TRRRDLVRAASDRENQCAGLGTQTGGRQRLSDERRVRGETQTLHRHLRDVGHIAQAQAPGSVAAAQRFIVGRADLIHQALDVGAGDVVVSEHAGEDLDRGLELFGDHDVGAEPAELGDFRHVTGARDDVEAGVETAPHPHHAASRRGVGDRDHEHAGALRTKGAQDLFAGGITVERGLAARAGLRPSRASTKENSPICETARPASRATRPEYPITAGPTAASRAFPPMITATPPRASAGCSRKNSTCTSMPTATKNREMNTSRNGKSSAIAWWP